MMAFWSVPSADLLRHLDASDEGLAAGEAARRRVAAGPNQLRGRNRVSGPLLLLRQFTSPIVLLLIGAALLSALVHDSMDAWIILAIVLVSGLLGFWQEYDATNTVDRLLAVVELTTTVLRGGGPTRVPVRDLVPGDVVELSAGSGVPADCRLLASRDLFVNEATLTGETFPVEKQPAVLPEHTPLAGRTNTLFMGTQVISGSGRALVAETGRRTELGRVSQRAGTRPPETDFERGVRHFGIFLLEVTLLLVFGIFAINVYLDKPVADSFLFALALAVGLTPQLLPAVVTVNLAKGARRMADRQVIVKRLAAIENFGSMDVLCSDKTGTLTEGRIAVRAALDAAGLASDRVLLYAYVNASFHAGFENPIDTALRSHRHIDLAAWRRLDEIPYDFARKRISVLAAEGDRPLLISKGAVETILGVCSDAEIDGTRRPLPEVEAGIRQHYARLSRDGFRTLAVAVRERPGAADARKSDEQHMTFAGLLVLHDPVKPDAASTVTALESSGVSLKVITGDNALVAAHVAASVGIPSPVVLTARDLHTISDDALPVRAAEVDVFAEIEPNQKERIVGALKRAGHVVGYMGDGLNDAPALHAADVSVSVQNAADVAKAAADIVLLRQDLAVLADGIREGRQTFANTLKYVFMATSANFGNMFSMAGASLFLPFLPLLPKQILLTNLLTDMPELAIGTDLVDRQWIERPHRWNVDFIRSFMLTFGALSSVFDFLTFGVLLYLLDAGVEEFRTGWFLESVISATLIVLVVRTRGRIGASRPSSLLLATTCAVIAMTLLLPWTGLAGTFGFRPVPSSYLLVMGAIVLAYVASAELVKRWFYERIHP